MKFSPHIAFLGKCKEAFETYQSIFGSDSLQMVTYGETPAKEHMPEEMHSQIIHARMKIANIDLMGADCPPERYTGKPTGFEIAVQVDSVAEAQRIYDALTPGANIIMPLGPTFWSQSFAMFEDRFGIPWMVNCELPCQAQIDVGCQAQNTVQDTQAA